MNSTFHGASETEEIFFKERMENGFENLSLPRVFLPTPAPTKICDVGKGTIIHNLED